MSRDASTRSDGRLLVVLCASVTAACVVALLLLGVGETGTRSVIRLTARIGVVIFCAAFSASSLSGLVPHPASRWLLRHRRQLGLSFAFTHTLHLAAIMWLGRLSAEFREGLDAVTLAGGGLAYVFLWAMAATSFDGAVKWLGRRRWTILHRTGVWYIWILFFQSYLPRSLQAPAYVPATLLLLTAMGLRIVAGARQRRRARTVSPVYSAPRPLP